MKIPSTWQALPAGKQFLLSEFQQGTSEYKKVATEFAKTVGHHQIHKVYVCLNASRDFSRYSDCLQGEFLDCTPTCQNHILIIHIVFLL